MESPELPNSSHNDRKKTNKSLLDERHKTDEALKATHRHLARQTDQSIEAERARTDSKLEVESANTTNGGHTMETIETERAQADSALGIEREEQAWLDSILLSRERRRTDEDLAMERQQTDAAFEKVSQSLEDEQTAHSATRKALLTRDEILAIVSHDLRNPIGTVLSCSSLLLEKQAFFHLGPDTGRWIRIIKRNAESALGLIRNLMDMESLANGKLALMMRDVDICELIQQLAENFYNDARVRFINLKVCIEDDALRVSFDRERILQVLSNLVGNAMKFTPKHGSVTIEARRNDAHDIEVSISDSGPGIPIEMRELIFERFSQLGTHDQSGLGLGLYIAKEIVEAHHGRLSIDSAAGGGSRFTFTLPN